MILGLLFFVHAGLTGRWTNIPGHVGFSLLIFMVLLLFYSRRWIGGGDVKLLTMAFLWTGISNGFVFSALLCVFATLVCTENLICVDGVIESPMLTQCSGC